MALLKIALGCPCAVTALPAGRTPRDDIRNVITTIDGFRAYYLLRTAEGATTISVFDDQAGGEASTAAAADYVRENMADVSPGPLARNW